MRRSNRRSAQSGSGDSTSNPGKAEPRAGQTRALAAARLSFALSGFRNGTWSAVLAWGRVSDPFKPGKVRLVPPGAPGPAG